jgi:3D (Asp-Asp-Asp) domain-containing protein
MPTEGMTVAGPRAVPFGTVVEIEGVGRRQVQDRTAARFDDRFDVFFADHAAARRFGIRKATVRIGNGGGR